MRKSIVDHPARIVPLAFLATVLIGTALLSLPWATTSGSPAPLLTALFTATSAACVTGLITVDTATYWSPFGQAAILGLFSWVARSLDEAGIAEEPQAGLVGRVGAAIKGLFSRTRS